MTAYRQQTRRVFYKNTPIVTPPPPPTSGSINLYKYRPTETNPIRKKFFDAQQWCYYLHGYPTSRQATIDQIKLKAATVPIVIISRAHQTGEWTAAEIADMKSTGAVILSYLCISQVESWASYCAGRPDRQAAWGAKFQYAPFAIGFDAFWGVVNVEQSHPQWLAIMQEILQVQLVTQNADGIMYDVAHQPNLPYAYSAYNDIFELRAKLILQIARQIKSTCINMCNTLFYALGKIVNGATVPSGAENLIDANMFESMHWNSTDAADTRWQFHLGVSASQKSEIHLRHLAQAVKVMVWEYGFLTNHPDRLAPLKAIALAYDYCMGIDGGIPSSRGNAFPPVDWLAA